MCLSLYVCVCVCLCLTYTLVILHLIARRADASKRSVQILTSSWRASAGQTHTLINICEKREKSENVCFCQTDCTVWKSCSYFSCIINNSLTDTVFPIWSILITLMAETLEGTKSIDTLSIPAHLALEGTALIYVCKVNIKRIRTL